MAAASTLAAELERRGIRAHVSRADTERVCHTQINNVEVTVHFPTTQTNRAITWLDVHGELHHVQDTQIPLHSLADLVIESMS